MNKTKDKINNYSEESMRMWMKHEVNPTMYRDSISLSNSLRCSQDDIAKTYWEIEAHVINGREHLIKCDMVSLEGYKTLGRTFIYNICDALALAICVKHNSTGTADRTFSPFSGRKRRGFNPKCLKEVAKDSTGRRFELIYYEQEKSS